MVEAVRRDLVPPEQKGRQAEIDQSKRFGAVQRDAPDSFLPLKMSEQAQAVEQQGRRDERRRDAKRAEQFAFRGLDADDQRDGQSPEQGGKPPREPPERTEQFGIGRGFSHRRRRSGGGSREEGRGRRAAVAIFHFPSSLPGRLQSLLSSSAAPASPRSSGRCTP